MSRSILILWLGRLLNGICGAFEVSVAGSIMAIKAVTPSSYDCCTGLLELLGGIALIGQGIELNKLSLVLGFFTTYNSPVLSDPTLQ